MQLEKRYCMRVYIFLLPFNKQNLLGFCWKFLLLWRSQLDGFMIIRRNALIELDFVTTAISHEPRVDARRLGALLRLLCRLHLNEPGWLVGEHKHVLDNGWGNLVSEYEVVILERFCALENGQIIKSFIGEANQGEVEFLVHI